MTDKKLVRKLVYNITERYDGDFEYGLKVIRAFKLDLGSTMVFNWSRTPEGGPFWFDVYQTKCTSHDQLLKLLSKYVIDKDFVDLDFLL